MAASPPRPKLAVVVSSSATGDSRVRKTAIAAARDGWDVTVVGRSTTAEREVRSLGPITVIRVPVLEAMRVRAGQQPPGGMLRRWLAAGRPRIPPQVRPDGDWRRDWPELLDLDLAFGPVLGELRPDLIHAMDVAVTAVAARGTKRLRAAGRRCAWVYDVHEYVRGVDWQNEFRAGAYMDLERRMIRRADAIVTVSDQLAVILRDTYRLPTTPLTVGDAPVAEAAGHSPGRAGRRLRAECALGPKVPLLVHSGRAGTEPGLDTVVGALPALPGVHLALVGTPDSRELEALLATADSLAVRARIHLRPDVPHHDLPGYLSSADLGLSPFLRAPDCETSLPAEVAEYLHGGLPLVVSDTRTVRDFVVAHGVGEVFSAGDSASLAEAVTRALALRGRLAEQITPALLKELSWEQQCSGLLSLYRVLTDRQPPVRDVDIPWGLADQPSGSTGSSHPAPNGWRPLGATRVRLGLGPVNSAGQLAAFAQSVCRQRADVSAEVVMAVGRKTFDYPADVRLDSTALGSRRLQLEQLTRVLDRYTHLLADAFRPVLGYLNGTDVSGDLPALAQARIKVALLAHGSEVRNPARHLERNPHSLYRDAPDGLFEALTKTSARNRRIAADCGLPLFVTTPDLMHDLPMATWAPLVVDLEAWHCDQPVMERQRPIVLHAPSKRWTKGTERILPTLHSLHERGAIDFRLAEGLNRKEMHAQVLDADIIVDQFAIGCYGTFACEGMAAGKPVVAYWDQAAGDLAGIRPPLVNATPETLGEAMAELLDDRGATARIGAESLDYVRTHHDGRLTAQALDAFLC